MAVTQGGEIEGGRKGVRQGKIEDRKHNAKTGIVVQCENYVYTCTCLHLEHVCTLILQSLSLHHVLPHIPLAGAYQSLSSVIGHRDTTASASKTSVRGVVHRD